MSQSRILLLLEHHMNQQLLIDALKPYYQLQFDLQQPFDLCLMDGGGLRRYQQSLQAHRTENCQIFRPYLLLMSRQQVQGMMPAIREMIDDIIITPIEKIELKIRLEVLLRAHRLSIELKASNDKLWQLANTDSLTQLANRRYFDDYLAQEWLRAAREQLPLSLILCDVDFFKRYNDHYGHPQGDEILKQMGKILAKTIKRPADLASRYGGEEFALILPNTPIEGAIHLAHTLQTQLKQADIPHDVSPLQSQITLSMGIASVIPQPNTFADPLIHQADQALYQAKKEGRNRVVAYSHCKIF